MGILPKFSRFIFYQLLRFLSSIDTVQLQSPLFSLIFSDIYHDFHATKKAAEASFGSLLQSLRFLN